MLIEELIEKAFCDGYEYAQKEFVSIRQATKYAKRMATNAAKNRSFEGGAKRTIQIQRGGYKIPTEKALDRVSSVTASTVKKLLPISQDREILKQAAKDASKKKTR